MTYPIARIDPSVAGRERSPALWRQALDNYAQDPLLGTLRANSFVKPRTHDVVDTANDGWYLSEDGTLGATSPSFNTNTDPDGVAVVTATTGLDFEGVKVQAGESVTQGESIVLPTHATNPRGDVIFEARVFFDVTLNDTHFIGLAEPGVILASGTNLLPTIADYIGFYRFDAGPLQFVLANDDDGGGNSLAQAFNIVAQANVPDQAWVKLGFRVNHNQLTEIFFNGTVIKRTSDLGSAKIVVSKLALPIENLTRSISTARGIINNAAVSIPCERIECLVAE